jgi:hypothetical protein
MTIEQRKEMWIRYWNLGTVAGDRLCRGIEMTIAKRYASSTLNAFLRWTVRATEKKIS